MNQSQNQHESQRQHKISININHFWNKNPSLLCRLVYKQNQKKNKVIKHIKNITDLYQQIISIYVQLSQSITCNIKKFSDCLIQLEVLYVLLIKDEKKNIWWGWNKSQVILETIDYLEEENNQIMDLQTEKREVPQTKYQQQFNQIHQQSIQSHNQKEKNQNQDSRLNNSKIKRQEKYKSQNQIEDNKKKEKKQKSKKQSQKQFRPLRVRTHKPFYYETRIRKSKL